jgi:transcriptional regulator with XRE-family HTH domain
MLPQSQISAAFMEKSQHSTEYQRFLKALRQARKDAGLTQVEVARALGRHAPFVSNCEKGERRVDVIELAHFCRLYGVKLSAFLKKLRLD